MSASKSELCLPRENLYRANTRGVELRAADGGEDNGPVMRGHFAVFNQPTEINDVFEGNFIERFAAGAFKKTIAENREAMRVLFQHGFDSRVGDKPLGPIEELREDEEGAYYEVPLLDAGYVRDDVLPGLEAGLYGASFRFRVLREEIDEEPGVSDDNPQGLPERTVKEAQVLEFGPVTFPAYDGASAAVRSLRPSELVEGLAHDHRLPSEEASTTSRDGTEPERSGEEPPAEPEAEEAAGDSTPESEGSRGEDAPPTDSAEPEAHPDDGRRGKKAPLYGAKPKTPSWRL